MQRTRPTSECEGERHRRNQPAKANANLIQTKPTSTARDRWPRKIGTEQALDLAKANYESAKAAVDAAAASVVQAEAQVSQKEAAVAVARTNLNYTIIRSPIDGTVVARNVDVGQTVAASLQAPTIFAIAQDLQDARLRESRRVGRRTIRMGQQVTFKVDAFPKEVFKGAVTRSDEPDRAKRRDARRDHRL